MTFAQFSMYAFLIGVCMEATYVFFAQLKPKKRLKIALRKLKLAWRRGAGFRQRLDFYLLLWMWVTVVFLILGRF